MSVPAALTASSADSVLAGSPGLPGATIAGPSSVPAFASAPPPSHPLSARTAATTVARRAAERAGAVRRDINTATSMGT